MHYRLLHRLTQGAAAVAVVFTPAVAHTQAPSSTSSPELVSATSSPFASAAAAPKDGFFAGKVTHKDKSHFNVELTTSSGKVSATTGFSTKRCNKAGGGLWNSSRTFRTVGVKAGAFAVSKRYVYKYAGSANAHVVLKLRGRFSSSTTAAGRLSMNASISYGGGKMTCRFDLPWSSRWTSPPTPEPEPEPGADGDAELAPELGQ
jgi:hypothetical protein